MIAETNQAGRKSTQQGRRALCLILTTAAASVSVACVERITIYESDSMRDEPDGGSRGFGDAGSTPETSSADEAGFGPSNASSPEPGSEPEPEPPVAPEPDSGIDEDSTGCSDCPCGENQSCDEGLVCAANDTCVGSDWGRSCDTRNLLCQRAEPPCPEGQVPEIVNNCYGECVRIDTCECDAAEACPHTNEFTCILLTGRCSYYLP